MLNIIQNLISSLKNIFSKEVVVFIISLMPILELRGGMIAAAILNIPYIKAATICIIGNIFPIPFILLFLKKIFNWMDNWELTRGFVEHFRKMAHKNRTKVEKYGFWGLVLFVGIPLPGTGAWTGSLVASVFDMDIKKASLGIFLGIVLAFIIMSILSYGLISNIIR